jgi:hypothetical protein
MKNACNHVSKLHPAASKTINYTWRTFSDESGQQIDGCSPDNQG